jgi:hypothetical protein
LSGRHGQKHKSQKKKATTAPAARSNVQPGEDAATGKPEETLCQSDEQYREASVKLKDIDKPDPFDVALYGLVIAVIVGMIYYLQLRSIQDSVELGRKTMQIDQRAWLYPSIPNYFSFTGQTIPATVQLSNIGKTVAANVTGYVVATTFNKGESPIFDKYGVGYAHNVVDAGAIYPTEKPLDVPLQIVKYGARVQDQPTPIVPDADFVRRFNDKQAFIILFGRIDYCDVFGVKHWVKFCNGSGGALTSEGIKQCINYNRADNENVLDVACEYPLPAGSN